MSKNFNEEKKIILKMLKEGKITEEEALDLLDSIKDSRERKPNFSQFEFDSKFIDKITQAAVSFGKKSQEVISNLDFDDISINFRTNSDLKAKAERVRSADISDIDKPKLLIKNKNGKIKLNSWENEEIEVFSEIRFDDRFVSHTYDFFKLEKNEDTIKIEPDFEGASAKHFDMNLSISIPKKLFDTIEIYSTNSNLEISDIKAENLSAESTNAKISISDVYGNTAKISSTNAKIDIKNFEGENLNINTTNGKINVESLNTKNVDITTTNGTININDIKENVEKIGAYTNNGNISVSLADIKKPVKAKVKNHYKDIDANNFSDSIFSNFINEDGYIIAYSQRYNEDGDKLDIDASTYNGTINIR